MKIRIKEKIKAWINAARLRTIPLSISGVFVGAALAKYEGYQDNAIFGLALFATIGFQITSNFANDYGDGVKGTDNEDRIGPKRALQSGLLSKRELKNGILVSILINILSIVAVVIFSFGAEQLWYVGLFGLLGFLSIWAAIKYTMGQSAYGYKGLGDIFVFLFFGLLSVLGTMFLFTKYITLLAVLPSIAIGMLSVGVLNLNNLRDCASDKKAGKNTLIVKMGFNNGKKYHYALLIIAFVCILIFSFMANNGSLYLVPLLSFVPIFVHLRKVQKTLKPILLDPELKKLALSTFLLAVLLYLNYNFFS